MEKKSIVIISLIVLIVVTLSFLAFHMIFSTNNVEVGGANLELPDGYYVGTPLDNNEINLTDGTNEVFIAEYDNDDVNYFIDDYCNYKTKDNFTMLISNFTIGGVQVYNVTTVNFTDNVHYYFVEDGKTFSVFSWYANPQTEEVLYDLIDSLKS